MSKRAGHITTQEMLGSLDDFRALELINSAEVILVFGCSLGVTDSRWWNAVIKRLKSDSSKRFVVLFSYGFERKGGTAAVVRNRINCLKEKLFDSAGMADDELKAQLFDRIFILPSDAIISMPASLVVDPSESNGRK